MFTGLIQATGSVLWIRATDRGTQLQIAAPEVAEEARNGDSLAVNGCCLTVTGVRNDQITFDLLQETLERTNLKDLRRESIVNLERPLAADSRLAGHFVQGHVDCVAPILSFQQSAGDHRLEIELPPKFARYVVFKGSIAVNGISFTVAELRPKSFAVFVIPHTRRATNLFASQAGDCVNLEFDILAKYVERLLPRDVSPGKN